MAKKRPKISSKPEKVINRTNITDNITNLVISYRYLDRKNSKYDLAKLESKTKAQFYEDFFKKMSEYSQYENFKKQIASDRIYAKANHIHPIDWTDNRIRENSFSCLEDNLMQQVKGDCWQLGINNQGFRIQGFFIENVFYVVWLDPYHNLYDRK